MPLLDVTPCPVHVVDRGSGDAVVFLHAFPLQAAMWDYQVEALAAAQRCVTIDLPGFGQSPGPEAPEAMTMTAYADIVASVLDHLGIDSATVVGASMGGYVVMALLRRHPERVAQVVLAGTKARSDDAAAAARRTDQQEQIRGGAEIGSLAKGLVEGLMSSGSMSRPDLVEYVHALAEGATPGGWVSALEAMKGRDDSMLVLRRAGVRSLVVVGELDRVTPIADAMSLRSMLKGELVIVPGAGHLPNVEDPLAFNEALGAFLGVPAAAEVGAAGADAADAGTEAAAADAGITADASAPADEGATGSEITEGEATTGDAPDDATTDASA